MTLSFRTKAVVILLSHSLLSVSGAIASEQAGTITQLEGKVMLFTNPAKTPGSGGAKEGARALFEGQYYLVRDAKLGDRVEQGNILRTPPAAKARVVFENGDQYNVGPGTAYKVSWKSDSQDPGAASPEVNLMYGKLRGIVAKGGPRSKLQVRTASATMGVRGTDFFIASQDEDKGTEVSIIRGAVEVKPELPTELKQEARKAGLDKEIEKKIVAKPVLVKEGMSAEVSAPAPKVVEAVKEVLKEAAKESAAKPGTPGSASPALAKLEPAKLEPAIELRQTTKEDYSGIQKSSEIKAQPVAAASTNLQGQGTAQTTKNNPINEKIAQLEKKAIETTVTDIKATHPELLKNVDVTKIGSVTELHQASVQKLAVKAPEAPSKRKPYKSELEDLEGGAYDRYFTPAIE